MIPHPLTPPHHEPTQSRYINALERLFSLTRFGERLDLSAPRMMNEALGRPLDDYRNILIGGTNGKGSTCAALTHLAGLTQMQVGCFTSPHLVSFRERIRVGQELITAREVIEGVDVIFEVAERAGITLSFFEATWALATWFFALRQVDWVIWEVGLGGRLDATNVCEPQVSAIVSLSLDHTHILGDTLEEIAREKAPIFRSEGVALTAVQDETLTILRSVSPSHLQSLSDLMDVDEIDTIMDAHSVEGYGRCNQPNDLAQSRMTDTQHGRRNLALAWSIAQAAGWSPPSWTQATETQPWWTQVIWPGRLEYLNGIWLDCAHNPASARLIASWLEQYESKKKHRPRHLIIGMSEDKDHHKVLSILMCYCEQIIFVSPQYPRCLSASTLADLYHRQVVPNVKGTLPKVKVVHSLMKALREREINAITLVTGSCFLIGEARAWLLGVPFPEAGLSTTAR